MPRYKLTVEYDGTNFVGWQIQSVGTSIQGQLQKAVLAMSGENIVPAGAGRTDAGVHATAQVAHVDLSKVWEPDKVRDAMNHHLKPDRIAVVKCEPVEDSFDARFSATQRHYLYRIVNRRARLALEHNRSWHVPIPLDATAMHKAGSLLVGKHDFTTFRSVHCQSKSPIKNLTSLYVIRAGEDIRIEVSAPSFMHNQVRSIVGSLKCVGEGKWSAQDLQGALDAKKRSACGPVAPACGLYLVGVDYCS
ncbi:MAG: tRNA pseudouridine(38-40) synthase TruA [Pseudomonadota bacterium]